MMDIGYHVVGIHNVTANIGKRYVGVDCKFGLRAKGQQCWGRSDRTYIKDMKDPCEIRIPGCDLFLIVLGVEKAQNQVTLALFDNLPLDFCHRPAMNGIVSRQSGSHITYRTHAAKWAIVSRTD
jgi:hypothetical protein